MDTLDVDSPDHDYYLKYKFEIEREHDSQVFTRPQYRPIQTYRPYKLGDSISGAYIRAYNPALNDDGPAIFSFFEYPSQRIIDDNPVFMTVNDYEIYYDSRLNLPSIAGAGYRNDTARAFRLVPELEQYEQLILCTGHDSTGDGRWDPQITTLRIEDYDHDGFHEAFFYVNSAREYVPRLLVCVEMETLQREWSLPVASPLSRQNFLTGGDSANPVVIFTAYNPKQGVSDANFTDQLAYLTIVNNRGEIIFNRIIANHHGGIGITAGSEPGIYYVIHELPFISPDKFRQDSSYNYYLSKINLNGQILKSSLIPEKCAAIFLMPYEEYGPSLYLNTVSGMTKVFDTTFNLLAVYKNPGIGDYFGRIKIAGSEDSLYVFNNGIYSANLHKEMAFPFVMNLFQTLAVDNLGNSRVLAINTSNRFAIGHIVPRSFIEIAATFYHRNLNFIIISLAALIVGLFLINFWRLNLQRRLSYQKKRLNVVFEEINEAFYRTDENGIVTWVSPAALKILKFKEPEEIIGRPVKELYIDPTQRDELLAALDKEGEITDFECNLRNAQGEEIIVNTSSRLLKDKSGKVIGVEGLFRDITSYKKLIDALKHSERLYRQLIDSASEAIFSIDSKGIYQFVNHIAAERLKMTPDEIIGLTVYEIYEKNLADSIMGLVNKVCESGENVFDDRVIDIKGRRLHFVTSLSPIRNNSGKVISVLGIARDITQHDKTQQELKEERHFIESLLDTSNSLIICLDKDVNVVLFNKECEKVTGYNKEEVVGKYWPDIFMPKEIHHAGLHHFPEWVREHPSDSYEQPLITKSGEVRTILWSNSAIIHEDSNDILAIAVGVDVTEKNKTLMALRESESRFRELADLLPQIIFEIDREGNIIYVNQFGIDFAGYTRKDYEKGLKVMQFFKPEDQPQLKEDIGRVLQGERLLGMEYNLLNQAGELKPILTFSNPIEHNGRITGLRGVAIDISELKKINQALRESEARYRLLIENVKVSISVINYDGLFLFTNKTAAGYFGMSPEEFIGRTLGEIFPPEMAQRHLKDIREVIDSGRNYGSEVRTYIRDHWRWFYVNVYPFIGDLSKERTAMVVAHDIHEQKIAEDALRESEARISAQFQAIPVPTYTWQYTDNDFILINYNVAGEAITRGKIKEYLGKKAVEMYGDKPDIVQDMLTCFNEKKVIRKEIKYRFMSTGEEKYLNISYAFVPPNQILVHTEDITERKLAEIRMHRTDQEKYFQAKRTAGVFAHEIRNALFPATVALNKLKRGTILPDDTSKSIEEYAAIAESAVLKATDITRLISQYTKLDTEFMPEMVELGPILKELEVSNRLRLEEEGVILKIDSNLKQPVKSNRRQLIMALNNLLLNSLEALKEQREPEIDIRIERDNKFAKIIFEDNGSGIAPDNTERIFEPFFTSRAETGGTGIGLSMTRRIFEMYGGTIRVLENLETGTAFEIKIQLYDNQTSAT